MSGLRAAGGTIAVWVSCGFSSAAPMGAAGSGPSAGATQVAPAASPGDRAPHSAQDVAGAAAWAEPAVIALAAALASIPANHGFAAEARLLAPDQHLPGAEARLAEALGWAATGVGSGQPLPREAGAAELEALFRSLASPAVLERELHNTRQIRHLAWADGSCAEVTTVAGEIFSAALIRDGLGLLSDQGDRQVSVLPCSALPALLTADQLLQPLDRRPTFLQWLSQLDWRVERLEWPLVSLAADTDRTLAHWSVDVDLDRGLPLRVVARTRGGTVLAARFAYRPPVQPTAVESAAPLALPLSAVLSVQRRANGECVTQWIEIGPLETLDTVLRPAFVLGPTTVVVDARGARSEVLQPAGELGRLPPSLQAYFCGPGPAEAPKSGPWLDGAHGIRLLPPDEAPPPDRDDERGGAG
jgi:hypothetical protein